MWLASCGLATRTRTVMLVVAAAWAVWFFVQLG